MIPSVFYADFYSHECRLVVEIEKALPSAEAKERTDALRLLAAQHRVIHVTADELPDVESVLSKLADFIAAEDGFDMGAEEA